METTHHYAYLYRQLRTAGSPIPTNDLWIAAIVVQHHLTSSAATPILAHYHKSLRLAGVRDRTGRFFRLTRESTNINISNGTIT